MLHFGSHEPRRIETRLTTDVQRDFVRPMAEHVAAGLVAKGVQPRDGWHTVCHSEGTCTCWDFTYRGPARAGCKHLAAYHLDHHARDGTADDGLVQPVDWHTNGLPIFGNLLRLPASQTDRNPELPVVDWSGEGLPAFRGRIRALLDSLIAPTVLVAHGLWGQVLRAEVRGLDLAAAGELSNRQGCVYLLENGTESVLESPA